MLILIFVGIAMGRFGRPWWWPACLAAAVSPVALAWFAVTRANAGIDYPATGSAAFDIVGTIALYVITAFYSYGVGILWRRREAGLPS